MNIIFSPVRRPGHYTLRKDGDSLTIGGTAFDFAALPDGATLPLSAITGPMAEWFAGPVERDATGALTVRLVLPHGPGAPKAARFPAPLSVSADGPVDLPSHEAKDHA